MATEFNTRIQFKRDTSSNWTNKNPIILNGEIILVDTDSGELRAKIGDGSKTYTQLPFSDEVIRNLVTEHNVSETAHENMGWITSDSGLPSEPALINADTLGGIAANEYATKEYVGKSFFIQMSISGQTQQGDTILDIENSNVDNRITTQAYVDDNNRVWINNIRFRMINNEVVMGVRIYLPEEYRSIFVPVSGLFIEKLHHGSTGLVASLLVRFSSDIAIQSDNSYIFYSQDYQSASSIVIPNGYIGTLNA